MMKKTLSFFSLLSIVLLLGACARVQPIQNYQNQPVPTGLTKTQVGSSIEAAAKAKGWKAVRTKHGYISAAITARDHFAKVKIPYSAVSYSIMYDTSRNLMADRKGDIHRNYNKWVTLLNREIQAKLNMPK